MGGHVGLAQVTDLVAVNFQEGYYDCHLFVLQERSDHMAEY